MVHDIHRLIAALSPETYCAPAKRHAVRRLLDEGLRRNDPLTVRKAAELAQPMPINDVPLEELEPRSAFDPVALRHPLEWHSFSCDSMDQSLEAFYFNLLNQLDGHGWQVVKLVDHLNSAAGSGMGGDLARRTMKSQQEAARLLEASQELVGKMLRRVERIKELERQLAALSMAGSPPVPDLQTTPSQASVAVAGEYPAGEGVSRFLLSTGEARTRLEIERGQLRGQMELLRLYAHWVQPWLRSAQELRERGSHRADLVTAFNTSLMDVVLLARRKLPMEELIHDGELPRFLARTPHRNHTPCVLMEMRFRAAPRRVSTGTHVFRGRVEVGFTSYALHDEEVNHLQRELERDEVGQLLDAAGAGSIKATEALLGEIEKLLNEKPVPEPARENTDVNPFLALWSLLQNLWRWCWGGFARQPPAGLAPDSPTEHLLRSTAVLLSRRACLETYESLKRKAHAA